MAALHVEQRQTQTITAQHVERMNGVDAVTRAVDTRRAAIADGVAGKT